MARTLTFKIKLILTTRSSQIESSLIDSTHVKNWDFVWNGVKIAAVSVTTEAAGIDRQTGRTLGMVIQKKAIFPVRRFLPPISQTGVVCCTSVSTQRQ